MGIEAVFVVFGAVLLLTAIVGGGFEIRELRVPRVGAFVRVLAGVSGFAFVLLGIALSPLMELVYDPSSPPAASNSGIVAANNGAGDAGASSHSDAGDAASGFFQQTLANATDDASSTYTYAEITDATGLLRVEIPTAWDEVDGRSYEDEYGNTILDVRAADNLEAFETTWDEPGMIITASPDVSDAGVETFANRRLEVLESNCTYQESGPYDDGVYVGGYDYYTRCGGMGTEYLVVTALPEDGTFVIGAEIQIVDERDLDALDRMIATFLLDDGQFSTA